MRNLAGDEDCDVKIRGELDEAGIPRIRLQEPLKREVPASVVGKLGPFEFTRAWYYWVVKGPVPLHVAEEIYAHPVGRKDVRIGGHCGCPAPSEYGVRRYDATGVRLYSDPDGKRQQEWDAIMKDDPEFAKEVDAFRFVPDAKAVAASAFVELYHIDSQEGLNLFVETMRRHGLVNEAA